MSQQLTNKEIAKVFALYACTECFRGYLWTDKTASVDFLNGCLKENMDRRWDMYLTPLDQISDEDAIEVARLCFQMPNGNFIIEKRDKYGLHIYKRERNGIQYHCRLCFNGEIKPNMHFEADEKEPFRTFTHQIGGVSFTDKRPIPYLAIVDFYRIKGYDTPLFFSPNHPANGKTAIELNIAISTTTLK